jgi:serpin B
MNHNTLRTVSRSLFTTSLALALLAGCGDGTTPDDPGLPFESARSVRARITTPTVSADDRAALVRGHTTFAVDAYRELARSPGNLIYSPHSVQLALAMAWAGARTNTEAQMATALRFQLPQARQHAAFNALDQEIAAHAARPVESGESLKLRVVNALWGQRGHGFLPSYLDTLAENYGAGVNLVDFERDAEGERARINAAVSEQTERRIPQLLPAGTVSAATRLVLTNAVYFKASWAEAFNPEYTAPSAFHLADGTTASARYMGRTGDYAYVAGEGYEAVELPYAGGQTSMVMILPAAGTFADFERALTAERLQRITAGLQMRSVGLTIPTFSFQSSTGLKQLLQSMGMNDAFADSADFSGIDGTRELRVSDVIHQGFIAVNERGTEAAAATAVTFVGTAYMEPATFTANRPFLFVIRDRPTGATLFMGRVVDPR